MRLHQFFALILLKVTSYELQAQSVDSNHLGHQRNALFLEVFSGPVFYSVNYQRIVPNRSRLAFSYRASASYQQGYQSLSGYVGGLWGQPRKAIEFMLGSGLYRSRGETINIAGHAVLYSHLFVNPQLGFRGERTDKGLLIRATLSPWLLLDDEPKKIRFTPGIGFSIGKVF